MKKFLNFFTVIILVFIWGFIFYPQNKENAIDSDFSVNTEYSISADSIWYYDETATSQNQLTQDSINYQGHELYPYMVIELPSFIDYLYSSTGDLNDMSISFVVDDYWYNESGQSEYYGEINVTLDYKKEIKSSDIPEHPDHEINAIEIFEADYSNVTEFRDNPETSQDEPIESQVAIVGLYFDIEGHNDKILILSENYFSSDPDIQAANTDSIQIDSFTITTSIQPIVSGGPNLSIPTINNITTIKVGTENALIAIDGENIDNPESLIILDEMGMSIRYTYIGQTTGYYVYLLQGLESNKTYQNLSFWYYNPITQQPQELYVWQEGFTTEMESLPYNEVNATIIETNDSTIVFSIYIDLYGRNPSDVTAYYGGSEIQIQHLSSFGSTHYYAIYGLENNTFYEDIELIYSGDNYYDAVTVHLNGWTDFVPVTINSDDPYSFVINDNQLYVEINFTDLGYIQGDEDIESIYIQTGSGTEITPLNWTIGEDSIIFLFDNTGNNLVQEETIEFYFPTSADHYSDGTVNYFYDINNPTLVIDFPSETVINNVYNGQYESLTNQITFDANVTYGSSGTINDLTFYGFEGINSQISKYNVNAEDLTVESLGGGNYHYTVYNVPFSSYINIKAIEIGNYVYILDSANDTDFYSNLGDVDTSEENLITGYYDYNNETGELQFYVSFYDDDNFVPYSINVYDANNYNLTNYVSFDGVINGGSAKSYYETYKYTINLQELYQNEEYEADVKEEMLIVLPSDVDSTTGEFTYSQADSRYFNVYNETVPVATTSGEVLWGLYILTFIIAILVGTWLILSAIFNHGLKS